MKLLFSHNPKIKKEQKIFVLMDFSYPEELDESYFSFKHSVKVDQAWF